MGVKMNNLYVIDKDICPEYDNVIQRGQCSSCAYYGGFKMEVGQPCICCGYFEEEEKQER